VGVGYTDVAHLDGGINAWKEQGKPVEDSSEYQP
jgi:rhodanese-related sulfurtransferase